MAQVAVGGGGAQGQIKPGSHSGFYSNCNKESRKHFQLVEGDGSI